MTRPLAVALACALAACTRQEAPTGAARVAILPLENLSGDSSHDWIGAAAAAMAAAQAQGSAALHPMWSATRQDALRLRATRIVAGYYTVRDGGVRVSAIDEDLRSGKTRAFSFSTRTDAGPSAAASALAREIAGVAHDRGPKNAEAARHYASALLAEALDARREALEKALAADPAFGEARLGLVEVLMSRGDRGRIDALLREVPQGTDELSVARLEAIRAALAGDPEARLAALGKASAATPADSASAKTLADALAQRWRFDQAVAAYRRAIAADPENGLVWNDMAYAQAFSGDIDAARASLAEYEKLEPQSPNPRDSLGEVLHHHGRFAEAEAAFLEAHRRNPSFLAGGELAKAAQSALWRGDTARAEAHMKSFLDMRARSDAIGAERIAAQWDFLAGRRPQARTRLEALAAKAESSQDWAQLAVWSLIEGDRPRARGHAERSARAGKTGLSAVAALALFLTEPSATAAEWQARAARAFPGPALAGFQRQALAYALFADRRYGDAAPLLRQLVAAAPPTGDGLFRMMLGVALRETGAKEESAKTLSRYALPPAGGWDILFPLVFSRVK